MKQPCTKVWYPKDVGSFSQSNPIRVHLNEGRQVAVGSNGWFIESWSPFTKELFSLGGDKIGTREEPPKVPAPIESRKTGYITVGPDEQDKIPNTAWTANGIAPGWFGELYEGKPDAQITFDSNGKIIEIYSPSEKWVYDIDGNKISERAVPFAEHSIKAEKKNPLIHTDTPDDLIMYDPEHWIAGHLREGRHVTIDDKGNVLDIWDPKTGIQYDADHNEIGTRTDPYPSDNNISGLKTQIDLMNDQIRALRAQRSALPKAARAALTAQIALLSAQRGHVLWRWGRLIGRRRRMNQAYDRKRTEGK